MADLSKKKSKQIVSTVIDFLHDQREGTLLSEVAQQLHKVAKGSDKNQSITITSAIRLKEEEKKRIKHIFKSILNKEYPVKNRVNPDVIGGIKVEWGDFLLDLTLANRISQVKQALL